MRQSRGFTLIEVLIALVITAIALTLGFSSIRGAARTVEQLEQTVLAGWALDNAVNGLKLRGNDLANGREQAKEVLFGRSFVVESTVSRPEGELPLLQLAVRVAETTHPERNLAEFKGRVLYAPLAR